MKPTLTVVILCSDSATDTTYSCTYLNLLSIRILMTKLLTILCATFLLAVTGCQHEDIWDKLNDHEQRIEQLEKLCLELNSNLEALQTILAAVQENDYVTEVIKVVENGVEVGYCLTFAKGGTVTIYHGKDGADGAENSAPKVGVKKAADGAYYWTSGDEWLTNDEGDMIPATVQDPDGEYVTPQFRVADGKWYVSYDNGNSWREITQAAEDEEEIFQNVTYDQKYVYITLSDETQFKIPFHTDTKVVDLFIFMGQSNMSGRGVAAEAPEVPEGWGYEYKAISDPGKLLHMAEPFGLYEDNAASGVDDSNGENGNKRKGSSVAALTIAYYQHTDVPVVGVSCSKGGTSTTFWKVGGKPLNDAIARQLDAERWLAENGYTIRNNYMFWLQGESDSSMAPETYKSNLIAIVKEMIEKTGVTNCMMLRVGQPDTATATKKNSIIEAQTELCQTYTEFVMASNLIAGFPDDGLMKDTWHYTQEGYNILGTDAGKNVAFYANNGIEPNMYDPYYQGLYYPISKYTSIFDIVEDVPVIPEGVEVPMDGVLKEELFVSLENTWITDASTKIDIGKNAGYNMCYLPVDISDYSSISITAQADHNVYFQFFKDDYLSEVCDNRIIVDMGKTAVHEIPEGAKYFVVSHSRTNLSDVADGFGLYFPAALRIYKTTSESGTGPWAGKKMVVIGDSITAGSHHGDSPIWYQALASEIGITSVVASGQSGSAISTTSYYGTDYGPMVVRYQQLPADGDLYVVFGGTNDYTLSTPLGSIDDVEDISFYGALDVMINGLKKKAPKATIVFLTPLNRYGYGQTRVGKIKLITPYTKNDEGHDLYDYRQAIMDKCAEYSIPLVDVFLFPEFDFSQGQDGVSSFNSSATYAHPWTNDGLHPNHMGHPALGRNLVPYFTEIGVNAGFPGGNEDVNNSTGEW